MNLKNLTICIRNADLEGAKKVDVKIEDLLLLINTIQKLEVTNTALNKSLRVSHNHYNSLLAQALAEKPIRELSTYA